jgi:hypothetical protein
MDAPAPEAIDELARDVERVESLRAVKDVQRAYAQLSQFGRWDAMAGLFAEDGVIVWGEQSVTGRGAIAAWLATQAGAMNGQVPGSLHTEIIDEPLANLSVDGRTAQVRWMTMRFLGDGAGSARIEGGLYENEYVRTGEQWRISTLHYHPQFEGEYHEGWANVGDADVPITPCHFTSDETGIPIPAPAGAAPPSGMTIEQLAQRIQRLNDEDAVRNLQNAYGYYVDRRMWSDVVDLFTEDGRVSIAGVGEFTGQEGIRQALQRMGPEGLTHGQLNERPIFDLIVDVLPDGAQAVSRGIELGLLGDADKKQGFWEFSVLRGRFTKHEGTWKVAELALTPLLRADYCAGWGDGGISAAARDGDVPQFPELGPVSRAVAAGWAPDRSADLADLTRRLARSRAYDGVENVSSAYGYYIDDFQWPEMAAIIATHGHKQSPFAGYYVGRNRVMGAATASWGSARGPRSAISFHWRTQPVIHVSHDGRSAHLRTRLFQPRTSKRALETPPRFHMGGLHSGMYPNDQAVLENGIWRLWSVTIDEHYFVSPSWQAGWAGAEDQPEGKQPPPSKLLTSYPPDILLTDLGRREEGFRGGTGTPVDWPGILPMWFHYRNPVSGRMPERYWPDCVPSEARPETRMTAHGYQMPPNGPEIDGVELTG